MQQALVLGGGASGLAAALAAARAGARRGATNDAFEDRITRLYSRYRSVTHGRTSPWMCSSS